MLNESPCSLLQGDSFVKALFIWQFGLMLSMRSVSAYRIQLHHTMDDNRRSSQAMAGVRVAPVAWASVGVRGYGIIEHSGRSRDFGTERGVNDPGMKTLAKGGKRKRRKTDEIQTESNR
jgi:hypothetical protein